MKTRQYIVSLSLILALSGLSFATSASELTLEQCREMAVENNLRLKSAANKISASKEMVSAYKTNYLPNLSLNANYLYSTSTFSQSLQGGYLPTFTPNPLTGELVPNVAVGGDGIPLVGADGTPVFNQYAFMPDQNFELEVGSIFNIGAQISQPIYMGGKIINGIKLSKIGVAVSELEQRKTRAEVVVGVDEAFFTHLKVEEMVESAHRYLAVVEEFHRQVANGYKSGMLKRNDLLKVEVRLNEAQLMVQRAENGLRLATMNLCYAVGLPLTTKNIALLDSQVDNQTIDRGILDVSSRPEYEMLKRQIEAKELEVKITKSDFLPSVAAIANYGYTNGLKLNNAKLCSDASFSGGVTASIPIFHWGEGRRKTSAKKQEIEVAQNQLNDAESMMMLELLSTINSYEESLLEVEFMKKSVSQAEENMRQGEHQFRVGMETTADLLEAQALWQKAMTDLVESRAKQRISYTKYLKAAGKL